MECNVTIGRSTGMLKSAVRRASAKLLADRELLNVFQIKGLKEWNPTVSAYGRYWYVKPGRDAVRCDIGLGICRTRLIAERRLFEYFDFVGLFPQMFILSIGSLEEKSRLVVCRSEDSAYGQTNSKRLCC
jgi:hypothetical protein